MNILSIDFDIIMYPCLKLYNDKICGDDNPTRLWESLEASLNLSNHLSYDVNILEAIQKVVLENVYRGARFISIEDHGTIISQLNTILENQSDDSIHMFNLDFHHDIFYDDGAPVRLKHFNQYGCADWAGYLMSEKTIETYTWIKAPNSDIFPEVLLEKVDFDAQNFYVKTLREFGEILETIEFDIIVLCLSPQWVPYQYHHLYDIICNIGNFLQEQGQKTDETIPVVVCEEITVNVNNEVDEEENDDGTTN